jgi:hypothetical protein
MACRVKRDVETGQKNYAFKCVTLCLIDEGGATRVCVKLLVVKSNMDLTPRQILGILENQLREDDTGVVRDVT